MPVRWTRASERRDYHRTHISEVVLAQELHTEGERLRQDVFAALDVHAAPQGPGEALPRRQVWRGQAIFWRRSRDSLSRWPLPRARGGAGGQRATHRRRAPSAVTVAGSRVTCPACGGQVAEAFINLHLDSDCTQHVAADAGAAPATGAARASVGDDAGRAGKLRLGKARTEGGGGAPKAVAVPGEWAGRQSPAREAVICCNLYE